MPNKKASALAKKQASSRAHASTAWQGFVALSGKAYVTQYMEDHPESVIHLERFCRTEPWNQTTEVAKSGPARFCRGRTFINRVPPTFNIQLIDSLVDGDHSAWLWKLHRKVRNAIEEISEFAFVLDPKARIKQAMDRRVEVYSALAVARHKSFGNRMNLITSKLSAFAEELDQRGQVDKDTVSLPWSTMGVYSFADSNGERIDIESLEGDAEAIEVPYVVHCSGLKVDVKKYKVNAAWVLKRNYSDALAVLEEPEAIREGINLKKLFLLSHKHQWPSFGDDQKAAVVADFGADKSDDEDEDEEKEKEKEKEVAAPRTPSGSPTKAKNPQSCGGMSPGMSPNPAAEPPAKRAKVLEVPPPPPGAGGAASLQPVS